MKDRIMKIMQVKNMTQQEFAQALEISPASLSNIFNERSNPTNYHVQAIHRCFPDINVNWLMFGEGDMYIKDNSCNKQQLQLQEHTNKMQLSNIDSLYPSIASIDNPDGEVSKNSNDLSNSFSSPLVKEVVRYIDKPQRKIKEIRIFFDDGTYEVYNGNL